jgi:hypothetical protein
MGMFVVLAKYIRTPGMVSTRSEALRGPWGSQARKHQVRGKLPPNLPHALVTDNGAQFYGKQFRNWCAELGIRNHYSTPVYPKSNGQVEATNKTLLGTLKKKLDPRKGLWVECVPEVLWSYRTTVRTPTGETPFSLSYGTKAVIPVEIGSPSYRVAQFDPNYNDEGICLRLDLL